MSKKTQRLALITEMLSAGFRGTQEELADRLSKRGHTVNQATISRDLEDLGTIRRNSPSGIIYEFEQTNGPPAALGLRLLAEHVLSAQACGTLVVIKTYPGMASSVASVIDGSIDDVIGTVAGDDTVLAVSNKAKQVAQTLSKGVSDGS